MKTAFRITLRQATQLTRKQNVIKATQLIKRALLGRGHAHSPDEQSPESARLIELQANVAESGAFEQPQRANAGLRHAAAERRLSGRMKRPLGEVLQLLRQGDLASFGHDYAPFVKSRKAPSVPVTWSVG